MTPCFHAACYSNLLSHLIFVISGALQPQSAPQKTKPSTRGWGGGKRSTVLEATSRKERQARSLSESNPLQKFTYSTVTTGVSAICFQRDVKKRRTTWNATPMERARTKRRGAPALVRSVIPRALSASCLFSLPPHGRIFTVIFKFLKQKLCAVPGYKLHTKHCKLVAAPQISHARQKKKKKKYPKVSFDQLKFMGTVGLKLMECSWILNIGFPILDVWEDMSRAGHKVGYDMWWETRSWSSTDSPFTNLGLIYKLHPVLFSIVKLGVCGP